MISAVAWCFLPNNQGTAFGKAALAGASGPSRTRI